MTNQTAHCVDPSGIRADDLVAYAWGEAGPAIVSHVDRCAACRDEAGAYARLDAALGARLFRRGCPESIIIGEYAMDLLASDTRRSVAEHLMECPYCLAESRDFKTFIGEPKPGRGEGIPGKLRRIFAQPFTAPSPALAGLRGSGDSGSATYTAGGLRLTVSVQRGSRGTGGNVLVGLIEQDGDDHTGAHAQLFEGETLLQTEEVDDLGNFLFSGVPSGIFRIEVTVPTAIVVIDPVQVQ
jgi:hypothetical protein